ncbi:hypothetical protein CVT24_010125 [Panaeolus cyanescens]|uniref:Uncharacterized protein n=1 Tax=Panaeolus cyanescens TaxID=181874 RepID=A0A409WMU0_9AGAR|nr:hypothetical protein CVT24_010125 [Panaeolus cyanescens]
MAYLPTATSSNIMASPIDETSSLALANMGANPSVSTDSSPESTIFQSSDGNLNVAVPNKCLEDAGAEL